MSTPGRGLFRPAVVVAVSQFVQLALQGGGGVTNRSRPTTTTAPMAQVPKENVVALALRGRLQLAGAGEAGWRPGRSRAAPVALRGSGVRRRRDQLR